MSDFLENSHKYTCALCQKQYTRKISLDKHKILCEFKLKTKTEHKIEEEEIGDTPNHEQLVKIVYELAFKYAQMEEKLENMQKWVDRKKKKINVIEWLNKNIKPTVGFLEWISTFINIKTAHFEYLMENNLFQTIQFAFEYNLTKEDDDFIYPIKCFSQKNNVFYIYDNDTWKQMEITEMAKFLKKIQNKFLEELTIWKKENQDKMDDSDKLSESFNKAIIKLMNISFTQDATMSRIKSGLYNYLKVDLKAFIEYDFEF